MLTDKVPKIGTTPPTLVPRLITANAVYSGDRYCGNDRYIGLKNRNDAVLFTVSGITAIADKKFGDFDKKDDFSA